MRKEIITIHVGQTGAELAKSFWKIFAKEENLSLSGTYNGQEGKGPSPVFFQEYQSNRFTPRVICVDLDPETMDYLVCGEMEEFFNPQSLIHGIQDASGCFSRARFDISENVREQFGEEFRRCMEDANNIEGTYCIHSTAGGTGSGLSPLLFQQIKEQSERLKIHSHGVYSSPNLVASTTEPYNSALYLNSVKDICELSFIYENEKIFELLKKIMPADRITYVHLNHLISQVLSNINNTISKAIQSTDLNTLSNNLIPFPELNMVSAALTPILKTQTRNKMNERYITQECYNGDSDFSQIDCRKGKFISCCLLYRGDVDMVQARKALGDLRKADRIQFVNWVASGLKLSVCRRRMESKIIAPTNQSLVRISNHTSITDFIEPLAVSFNKLLESRAYVHWYVSEGMEEGEFMDVSEYLDEFVEKRNRMLAAVGEDEDEDADYDEITQNTTDTTDTKN